MTAVRLFLHASSGVAWVIAGAALLGLSIHRNAPRRAADAWASVASVALVIVLATGLWNSMATEGSAVSDEHDGQLGLKLLAALVSFSAGWLHRRSTSRGVQVVSAAVLVGAGLVALYLGVALDAVDSATDGSG